MKSDKKIASKWDVANAAPRLKLGWRVATKTFGAKHSFMLTTRNVSQSGALLCVDDLKVFTPFRENTLLELEFYPDGQVLKEKLYMTAVVVRYVRDQVISGRKEMYGVRLIEAPPEFEQALQTAYS